MSTPMTELVDAIEAYFVTWRNSGKKPGWCERVAKARETLDAAINKAKEASKEKP